MKRAARRTGGVREGRGSAIRCCRADAAWAEGRGAGEGPRSGAGKEEQRGGRASGRRWRSCVGVGRRPVQDPRPRSWRAGETGGREAEREVRRDASAGPAERVGAEVVGGRRERRGNGCQRERGWSGGKGREREPSGFASAHERDRRKEPGGERAKERGQERLRKGADRAGRERRGAGAEGGADGRGSGRKG